MKYCPTCRAELNDNATFCPRCGQNLNMTNNSYSNPNYGAPQYSQPNPQYSQPAPHYTQPMLKPNNEENKVVTIFGFITNILALITVFFLLTAMIEQHIYVSVYQSSGYYYNDFNSYAYSYPDYDLAIVALVLAIMTFGAALTTFITTLAKARKIDKVLSAVTKLVIGSFAVLVTILAM